MSLSISSLLSNYTYSTTTLRPKIDKDADSQWSQTELETYTQAYTQATGTTLDAASIMKTYDASGDGSLDSQEQETILADDALGLSTLTGLTSEEDEETSESYLDEILSSMSTSEQVQYSMLTMQSNLISALFGTSSDDDSDSLFSGMTELFNLQVQQVIDKYKAASSAQDETAAESTLSVSV
jgi:hypothetical protein